MGTTTLREFHEAPGPAKGRQVEAVERYIRTSTPEDLRGELTDLLDATRSTDAILVDADAFVRAWPFDLRAVDAPVELWHGRLDPAAPVGSALALAAILPRGHARPFDGEGHSILHSHGDEIVAWIVRASVR